MRCCLFDGQPPHPNNNIIGHSRLRDIVFLVDIASICFHQASRILHKQNARTSVIPAEGAEDMMRKFGWAGFGVIKCATRAAAEGCITLMEPKQIGIKDHNRVNTGLVHRGACGSATKREA